MSSIEGAVAVREAAASGSDLERILLKGRFIFFHALCGLVYFVGVSWPAVALCLGLYYLRMFAITATYHRYLAHRTFKMGRVFQFLMVALATTALQKGPLWWAAHHRYHHRHSDTEDDIHSPTRRGFLWAHMGWIISDRYDATEWDLIRDFARFPELRFLNTYHWLPYALGMVALLALGGWQAVVWGGIVSTILLWHGTFTINSLAHVFGKRVYETTDTSRNSLLLALITMGEGWHNNHHYHQNTANQGWFWWEWDPSYYLLRALSWLGVVWDLRTPSPVVKYAYQRYAPEERAMLRGSRLSAHPSLAKLKEAGEQVRSALATPEALRAPEPSP